MIKVETCDAALVTSALTGHLQVLASAVSTCLGEASSQFEAEVGGAAQPLRPQLVRPKAGI